MRRWAFTSVLAVAGFAAFAYFSRQSIGNPFPEIRTFQLTYDAKITGLPAGAGQVRVWLPLAGERDGQVLKERTITAPGPYRITRDPVHGNEILYYEGPAAPTASLEFRVDYTAQVDRRAFRGSVDTADAEAYLRPSRWMVVNDEVQRRAGKAVGTARTVPEKARAIYEDVMKSMVYDKTTPGWGKGDTVRACLLGRGNCTDFHSLFISMAQAAGLPARFKIGFTVPREPEGAIAGYHCWAEYYDPEQGWQPVDVSDAWKHPERKEAYFGNFDTNKFLVSVGRDIRLDPVPSGEAVNIFFYPYVEVDGRPFPEIETAFHYKNL